MKILFATNEVAPFSKAGGLGDVMGSLPKELEKYKDNTIAIFTPLHGCIDKNKYNIKELENSKLRILFEGKERIFKLYMTKLPNTNINVFFIDCLYYFGCFQEVYPKWLDRRYEHERYVAFSLAILEYAKLLNFRPDIIHANDWHTAMLSAYLRSNYNMDEFYNKAKTVFSIHNLAYQGVYEQDILDFANMQKNRVYHSYGLEHYNEVNWMKGAINFSDKIIVVSPTYSKEIMTEEYGEGMDFTLRGARNKIIGILNGIDYSIFNPKCDNNIISKYDTSCLENKEKCKKEILAEFSLDYKKDRPLIIMISRLVEQKGFRLIRDMENHLRHLQADFIMLGTGDKDLENLFIWLSNNTSNIRARIDYKEDIAHRLYAGGDFFLMPSRFEPCGLSQLISLKYGTLPIVRATGGLEDTVVGYPLNDSNGFKFWRFNGYDMLDAINCAISVYKDKYTLNAMRKSAMNYNFTWEKSAKKYMDVYNELLSK